MFRPISLSGCLCQLIKITTTVSGWRERGLPLQTSLALYADVHRYPYLDVCLQPDVIEGNGILPEVLRSKAVFDMRTIKKKKTKKKL